ncbi:MAG TPA: hypothetical protein VFE50_06830 [Cyclobacteriaceae bacterium]|nr:hypothetical protein [Cyclobacteriaceae bacterium]
MKHDKSNILAAAIASQKGIIKDLEQRKNDIMANDGNVNEEEYDRTEQSIKSSLIDEAEAISDELHFVRDELRELEKIKVHAASKTVVPGAVVVTNRGDFFVSASIEGFNVGKSHFFGLSRRSPLYKKMQGRKVGARFRLNKLDYVIKEIY